MCPDNDMSATLGYFNAKKLRLSLYTTPILQTYIEESRSAQVRPEWWDLRLNGEAD